MKTDTPETDKAICAVSSMSDKALVYADFARNLERQRNALYEKGKELAERVKDCASDCPHSVRRLADEMLAALALIESTKGE